jgi:hypothetical protein
MIGHELHRRIGLAVQHLCGIGNAWALIDSLARSQWMSAVFSAFFVLWIARWNQAKPRDQHGNQDPN